MLAEVARQYGQKRKPTKTSFKGTFTVTVTRPILLVHRLFASLSWPGSRWLTFTQLLKQNYLLSELLRPLSPVTSILGGTRAPLFKQNYLLSELLQPLSPVARILGGIWVPLNKTTCCWNYCGRCLQ
jgi:hypothetical protein